MKRNFNQSNVMKFLTTGLLTLALAALGQAQQPPAPPSPPVPVPPAPPAPGGNEAADPTADPDAAANAILDALDNEAIEAEDAPLAMDDVDINGHGLSGHSGGWNCGMAMATTATASATASTTTATAKGMATAIATRCNCRPIVN